MKEVLGYTITPDTIIIIANGETIVVSRKGERGKRIANALKAGGVTAEEIRQLADPTEYINLASGGRLAIKEDGTASIDGKPLPGVLASRIAGFMREGLPFTHLIKFWEKLQQNPSKRSVDQLYKFLEHGGMPITPDGNFLGYKGIRDDNMDVHSGKVDNSVGNRIRMPRNHVCDDPNQGCSYGFHVGSEEYATHWGQKTVIVEVNPAHVVSVPHDCNYQKLRTCEYKVVAEYETRMKETAVASSENPYIEITRDEDDDFEGIDEIQVTITTD